MKRLWVWLLLLAAILSAACAPAARANDGQQPARAENPAPTPIQPPAAAETTALPSTEVQPTAPSSPEKDPPAVPPTARPQPSPTFDPRAWVDAPVIPELSPRALEILRDGLAKGRNPRAFSKIGDCESQASWFLEAYDLGPQHYSLGEWEAELSPVIDHYRGSFQRLSLAAKPGFTASSLLAPIWSDRQQCEKNETPLACEYRVHNPLVAFIMIGTNDASNPKTFEGHMRRVIEASLEAGVLPVLGTKADNVEGDHYLNATIARLAHEYGLPLWNYWAAVQPLPGKGLQEDGVHLTFAAPYFDNPEAMRRAWPVRNLNALQVLSVLQSAEASLR